MKILIKDKNNSYSIDQGLGICISIPYNYNGDQPNFYNSPQGKSHSMQQDGFIGEISKGMFEQQESNYDEKDLLEEEKIHTLNHEVTRLIENLENSELKKNEIQT